LPTEERLRRARPRLEQTYSSYGASAALIKVLKEDVGLRFSTVRLDGAFAETVACAVTNLVGEVADARNCARFRLNLRLPCRFTMYPGFRCHDLDARHQLWQGQLPGRLLPDATQFEHLWQLHPQEYNTIKVHGRVVKTPRWEQAYNRSYCYSGYVNLAEQVPQAIAPFWHWAQDTIDDRLNGILMTWYDGSLGHYIGKHRDSTQNLIPGGPIVTLSLGQSRVFRLRPWQGKGYQDFPAEPGTVFVMPFATNLAWTHEVPAAKKYDGRRIAITFRAFAT